MKKQGDTLQLQGQQREDILNKVSLQIKDWNLDMPAVDPLVMDFGQGEFNRVGLVEYWIANEIEAGYCGKYLFLFDGQQCPFHGHKQKHETFYVVKGKISMTVNDKDQILNQGDVLAMPPGDIHSFTGIGNSLVLEISTPCLVDDNEFQEPKIVQWHKECLK